MSKYFIILICLVAIIGCTPEISADNEADSGMNGKSSYKVRREIKALMKQLRNGDEKAIDKLVAYGPAAYNALKNEWINSATGTSEWYALMALTRLKDKRVMLALPKKITTVGQYEAVIEKYFNAVMGQEHVVLRTRKDIKKWFDNNKDRLVWDSEKKCYTIMDNVCNKIDLIEYEISRLRNNDISVRVDAHSKLVKYKESAVPILIKNLPDQNISFLIIDILVDIGKPAVPYLLKALKKHKPPELVRLIYALGKIKVGFSINKLTPFLSHKDSNVRRIAANALGNIGDPKSIPSLRRMLNEKDDDVRFSVVVALTQMKDKDAISILANYLKNERVPFGTGNALIDLKSNAIPAVLNILKDKRWEIRSRAAGILLRIEDEFLFNRQKSHSEEEIIMWAVDSLRAYSFRSRYKKSEAIDKLVDILKKKKEPAFFMAASCLADEGASIRPNIMPLLASEKNDIRIGAVIVCGLMRDKMAIDSVIKCLRTENNKLDNIYIAWALQEITGKDFGTDAAKWQKWWTSNKARILKEELNKAEKDIELKEVIAAQKIALKEVNEALIKCEPRKNIRAATVRLIGYIGDKKAVPELINTLNDQEGCVRGAAAESLGMLGDSRAIPALIIALKDKDQIVIEYVQVALEKITKQDFGNDPDKWQEWWNENKDRILKEEAEKEKAGKEKESKEKKEAD